MNRTEDMRVFALAAKTMDFTHTEKGGASILKRLSNRSFGSGPDDCLQLVNDHFVVLLEFLVFHPLPASDHRFNQIFLFPNQVKQYCTDM